MDRINGSDWVDIGGGKRGFRDENLAAGTQGTVVNAAFLNAVQEEILTLLTAVGIAPSDAAWDQLAKAIQSGKINFAVAGGTANALTATLSPVPVLAAGLEISMLMTAAPTGAVTLALNGGAAIAAKDSRGMNIIAGAWGAGDIVTWRYNGTEWRAATAAARAHRYDLSAPPAADIMLNVGDTLTLTFANVSTIPLWTATVEGLYEVKLLVSASNTSDSNWMFKPNNATYTNAFSYGVIEHGDVEITSFGSAAANAGFTALTSSPNFIGSLPRSDYNRLSRSSFFMDLFFGPSGSDTIQGRGPSMQELLISTKTAAKMLKQSGQILASPSINASYWHDTTVAWSSLGTLVDQGATSMSGIIIIERLA